MRKRAATSQNSILGTSVKAIGRALDAAGHDGPALLAEAGFDLRELDGPDTRCPLFKTERLWRIALAVTSDPAFGVKLARYFNHTTFHALGYGISASSTLKEAFERVQRYYRVVSDVVGYQLIRHGSEYHFLIEPTTAVPDESIDALVGMHILMCRSLLGREFAPLMIELRRPRPASVADFERLWRAPMRFAAERNRLIVDAESIERILDSSNPELARLSDAISSRYLARIERYNIEARVRDVLTRRLPHNPPSQVDIAEFLHMTPRTLQRKLGESGTTFKDIVDETRYALAMAYLSAPQRSIHKITSLLGFSHSSSFTRAFRRWTGLSPRNWRTEAASRYLRSHQRSAPRPADRGAVSKIFADL